jgi:hypothetical protein
MDTQTNNTGAAPDPQGTDKRPNDSGKVHVDEFVKIHDPNTKQVYHEGRA